MHRFIDFVRSVEGRFVSETVVRLVIAAILGGVIGLERELKRKPAGLRTNMFICFGSAMFTLMSYRLASIYPGDHTRIAAQIIPGIGFIGAGSILHSRGSVTGLTTAATIFVVASIGMAVGGGLYLVSIFATLLIVISLILLGFVEERYSLKALLHSYEVIGSDGEAVIAAANEILEDEHKEMQSVHVGRTDHQYRVLFKVEATRNEHDNLMKRFHQSPAFSGVASLGEPEKE